MYKRVTPEALWFLTFILLSAGVLMPVFYLQNEISAWYASFWLFDYQYDFIKRGLVGEFISWFCDERCGDIRFIQAASYAVLYVLSFALALFVFFFFKQNRFIGICLIISGFSIQQFSFDVGRHDQINYILLLLAVMVIVAVRSRLLLTICLSVISVLMLLIHEVSLFMQIPVIFALLFIGSNVASYNQRPDMRIAIFLGLVVISAFAAIWVLGKTDQQQMAVIAQAAHAKSSGIKEHERYLIDKAAAVQARSLLDNIALTGEAVLKRKTVSRVLMIIAVSLPVIFFMVIAFKQVSKLNKNNGFLLLLPVISIVPLFVVAYDWYRWMAMMLLNFMLVLGFILYDQNIRLNVNKWLLSCWCIFAIYSGPYGVTLALPQRRYLIEHIKYMLN